MLVKDVYYTVSKKNEYTIDYEMFIKGFPVAYKLMTFAMYSMEKSRSLGGSSYPYYYMDDSRHFRINVKQYGKSRLNNYKNQKIERFYWCSSEPNDWVDAFRDNKEPKERKCYFDEELENQGIDVTYSVLYKNYRDFVESFDMVNIAQWPGFLKRYYRGKANEDVFKYMGDYDNIPYYLSNFGIGSLIIQFVGIILWGCGQFLGGLSE